MTSAKPWLLPIDLLGEACGQCVIFRQLATVAIVPRVALVRSKALIAH